MPTTIYMLPCISKTLFGIECLGCGAQRALVLLCQGRFWEAFCMYPAIYPLLALAVLWVLKKAGKTQRYNATMRYILIIALTFILFGYAYNHFL
jgi:uncharacterized membrane protein